MTTARRFAQIALPLTDLALATDLLWEEIPKPYRAPPKAQKSWKQLKAGQLLRLKVSWCGPKAALPCGQLVLVSEPVTHIGVWLLPISSNYFPKKKKETLPDLTSGDVSSTLPSTSSTKVNALQTTLQAPPLGSVPWSIEDWQRYLQRERKTTKQPKD